MTIAQSDREERVEMGKDAQQESFDKLKEALTSTPVLRMPTDEGKYRVEADSSDFAIGAVYHKNKKENGGLLHTCPSLSIQLKGTTTFMTRSCWLLLEP